MKKLLVLLGAVAAAIGFAQETEDPAALSKADLAALVKRVAQLEEASRAQAARIAELEAQNKALAESKSGGAGEASSRSKCDETAGGPGTPRPAGESGRVFTTDTGRKFYLADATAGIFEPLTEGGLQLTPYGYLTFEAVYNTHKTMCDIYSDWVMPRGNGRRNGDHQTVFSMNDSIIGFDFGAPEAVSGWKLGGKFEFDLAGDDANDPDFHFRHLYFTIENEEAGWNILFGQTWHLWKMVSPNEIDGAWMEQTGHPYRRSPQLRIAKTFKFDEDSALEVRAGIVKNGNGMGGDRDDDENHDNSASAWPLLEGAIVYERRAAWEDGDRRWLAGLAGMYGRDKSHRFAQDDAGDVLRLGESDEYDTKMIVGAAKIPFFDRFTFTGQMFAGENLSGVQAGVGQGVAIRDPERKGREVATLGGFFDLRCDIDERWAFAIGYGFDNPRDSHARYAEGRTFNERAYADIFYQFNENLHFAVEYARLRTRYYEDDDASDDRIQFTAFFDF